MNYRLLLFSGLLLVLQPVQSQVMDLGEGMLEMSMAVLTDIDDTVDMDKESCFEYFTYYVKGDRVLRKEDPDRTKEAFSTEFIRNDFLSMALTLSVMEPTFLLDLTRKKAQWLYQDSSQRVYVYEEPLSTFNSGFFRDFSTYEQSARQKVFDEKSKQKIPGTENTYSARFFYTEHGKITDTIHVQYVKQPWPIQSPLNHWFSSPELDGANVTRILGPIDAGQNNDKRGTYILIDVCKVIDKKLDDKLFVLPDSAIRVSDKQKILDLYTGNYKLEDR